MCHVVRFFMHFSSNKIARGLDRGKKMWYTLREGNDGKSNRFCGSEREGIVAESSLERGAVKTTPEPSVTSRP